MSLNMFAEKIIIDDDLNTANNDQQNINNNLGMTACPSIFFAVIVYMET